MYQMVRPQGLAWTVSREAAPAGVALVLAELLYKFHSFTLELLAFLATWYGLSWLWSYVAPGDR
ncbi:MAG: hypothetical protein A2Z31_08265 [candidate division NC10 bacterium RBG_16_65_8]|nr:MAG: hypothetical protein A2Z31_08265 [candidate division NC10 bacterium RBG_16_65_8]